MHEFRELGHRRMRVFKQIGGDTLFKDEENLIPQIFNSLCGFYGGARCFVSDHQPQVSRMHIQRALPPPLFEPTPKGA